MVDTSKVVNKIQARSQAESPQLRRHRGVVQSVAADGTVGITLDGGTTVLTGVRRLGSAALMVGQTVEVIGDDTDLLVIGPINDTPNGSMRVWALGSLDFGSTLRQMINLWGTSYGIGVQSYSQYFRAGGSTDYRHRFKWYVGGEHSDTIDDPGPGGVTLATLLQSGFQVHDGGVDAWLAQDKYSATTRGDDALIPNGVSTMQSTSGGWPTTYGSRVHIRTYKSSQAHQGTLQYAIDEAQDPPEIWVRRWKIGGGGLWSSWVLLTTTPKVQMNLLNNWTHYGGNYGNATYQKEAGNIVKIEGLVKPGTATTIASLPAGFIPKKQVIFTGATGNSNSVGRVDVDLNGNVVSHGGTSMPWLSLSQITYVAEG